MIFLLLLEVFSATLLKTDSRKYLRHMKKFRHKQFVASEVVDFFIHLELSQEYPGDDALCVYLLNDVRTDKLLIQSIFNASVKHENSEVALLALRKGAKLSELPEEIGVSHEEFLKKNGELECPVCFLGIPEDPEQVSKCLNSHCLHSECFYRNLS
jgi:hypothetical protein